MRLALLAACVLLPASAFLLGCGGHRQSASTSPDIDAAAGTMPTTMMSRDHQPPPRTPEQ